MITNQASKVADNIFNYVVIDKLSFAEALEKERQRDFLGTDVYEGVLKQKIEQLEAKNKTAESKPDTGGSESGAPSLNDMTAIEMESLKRGDAVRYTGPSGAAVNDTVFEVWTEDEGNTVGVKTEGGEVFKKAVELTDREREFGFNHKYRGLSLGEIRKMYEGASTRTEQDALRVEIEKRVAAGEKDSRSESKPNQEIHPLAGFANAHEAARYIAENSEDESYRAIAGRISEFIGENVEYIIVQPDVEVPGGVPRTLNIANGVNYENYKTGRRAIYLRGDKFNGENGMNETVVLHELIHAATAERINDGNKAKNKNTTLALPFKISISCSTVSPPT